MDFNIDLFNMTKLLDEFADYGRAVDQAMEDGLEDFAQKFMSKLDENAIKYGVPDIYSASYIVNGHILTISIDGEEMFYFEYGTGIVGEENPHPKDPWAYDVNNHGEDGWIYFPTQSYQLSYADDYITTKDGRIMAHTKGMPSKPFIYDTWMWSKRSITNVLRKHLRKLGGS